MSALGMHVGSFYLLLGEPRPPQPLPNNIERGPLKQCYMTAGRLAINWPGLAYCEGFALREGLFPMHHAWCLDKKGGIVDPTWPFSIHNEYWGVALSEDFVREERARTGVWGCLSEMLPAAILTAHPDSYLHLVFRPPAFRLQKFVNLVQSLGGRNGKALRGAQSFEG